MESEKLTQTVIYEQIIEALEPWVADIDLLDKLNEDTNPISDLGLDSIGILQMSLEVEKTFGITIQNHELDSQLLSRIGNIVEMVRKKLDENN
jgi:acyl carrier protein